MVVLEGLYGAAGSDGPEGCARAGISTRAAPVCTAHDLVHNAGSRAYAQGTGARGGGGGAAALSRAPRWPAPSHGLLSAHVSAMSL